MCLNCSCIYWGCDVGTGGPEDAWETEVLLEFELDTEEWVDGSLPRLESGIVIAVVHLRLTFPCWTELRMSKFPLYHKS